MIQKDQVVIKKAILPGPGQVHVPGRDQGVPALQRLRHAAGGLR